MKTKIFRKIAWISIVTFAILFTSCKKSADSLKPKQDNELKATISIISIAEQTSIFSSAGSSVLNFVGYGGVINITGWDDNDKSYLKPGKSRTQVSLGFRNINKAGNYIFGDGNSSCQYFNGAYYSTSFQNASGTFTIDSISTHYIKGSFTTTCKNNSNVYDNTVVQITSGSFKGSFGRGFWE